MGYAEILPGGALPLAGYAPVGGVFLVSLAVALCAAAVSRDRWSRGGAVRAAFGAILARRRARGDRRALPRIEWTVPTGAPVAISLVQGNVSQAQKFDPAFRAEQLSSSTTR